MGPFSSYFGNKYILVDIHYASKWVEAIASLRNDVVVVVKIFKNIISQDLEFLELL